MLLEVGDNVYVWSGQGRLDTPNAGVIVEDDGITVVDALLAPSQSSELAAALEPFGRPVRRLVLTSSHVPYVGGSRSFALAAVYGSTTTNANLELPPNIGGYQHLFPAHAAEFEDLRCRNVSHVVTDAAWLSGRVIAAPLAGQQTTNLVVQVPDANVAFGGGLCSFDARPLGFEADFAAWRESLTQLDAWAAVIVPGVGPVGGHDEIEVLRAYFDAVLTAATDDRGVASLARGPWDSWAHGEFDVVNVERAALSARGQIGPPRSALALFGLI